MSNPALVHPAPPEESSIKTGSGVKGQASGIMDKIKSMDQTDAADHVGKLFTALLSLLDLLGGVSVISLSADLLFVAKLTSQFSSTMSSLLTAMAYLLAFFGASEFIDGCEEFTNIFDADEVPLLSNLLMDWVLDIAALVILVPLLSAYGEEIGSTLPAIALIQTIIMLFLAVKIESKFYKWGLVALILVIGIGGTILALTFASIVRNLLSAVTGDEDDDFEFDTSFEEILGFLIFTLVFFLVAYIGIGLTSMTMWLNSQSDRKDNLKTYFTPWAQMIWDFFINTKYISIPCFPLLFPLLKAFKLVFWIFVHAKESLLALLKLKVSAKGEIVFHTKAEAPYAADDDQSKNQSGGA